MRYKLLFLILVLTIFKAFTIDLIATRPLNDYDEARYAEVAKNIVKTDGWLVPLAGGPDEPRELVYAKLENGEELYPFFWKPPLTMWRQAIAMKIFGVNEFAVRFPSLVASLGILVVLFFLLRLYKVRSLIALPLLLIFSISYDFSYLASQGTTDALLTFLSLVVIYFSHRDEKYSVVIAGIATGLAFLTKSVATFWILPLYILIKILRKKFSVREICIYVVSSVLIAAPWFMYMYLTFGDIFIARHFLLNLNGGAAVRQNIAPTQWYLIYMLDMWKPLVFLSPLVIYVTLKKIVEGDRRFLIIFLWICFILIPFSLSTSKVWWYIYPMWPAFIVLLGLSLQEVMKNKIHLALVFTLLFMSLLPYWQLSTQHIPLKPFLALIAVTTGIFFMLQRTARKNYDKVAVAMMLIMVGITTYHSHLNFPKNPAMNSSIKNLAARNQNLTNISVLGRAYEAPLFYFNSGNVLTSITSYESDDYLIVKMGSIIPDSKKFDLIDKEGDLLLYKRKAE
ncbi:glycosyltransferase family 39 protein [Candidatus Woesebacteria bacterium]|nr:glycosyltransferase family 39 protein [Candidatus Woesebacteria bacterium]